MKIKLFYILLLFVLCSCSNLPEKFVNVSEGMQYISDPDNGFVVDTILPNEVKVQVQLIPASLIQKTNTAGKQKYFSIQFSYKGNELLAQLPREEYGSYVQLFSFGMDRVIKLITADGKEFQADMVSYQPTYSMGKSNELTVVFDQHISKDQNVTLIVDEFGLQLGTLKFFIDKSRINYSPTIDQL
ncbi:hypothetical protein [Sphingobacterium anhuiense]|uniref:hypothetical protein n=1 Tax=Sphingobacterium anhuiense TaxID=493780 RepID=UPI003C2B40C0